MFGLKENRIKKGKKIERKKEKKIKKRWKLIFL